jgi:hypothetical protein
MMKLLGFIGVRVCPAGRLAPVRFEVTNLHLSIETAAPVPSACTIGFSQVFHFSFGSRQW